MITIYRERMCSLCRLVFVANSDGGWPTDYIISLVHCFQTIVYVYQASAL